jgi:hypothetical protein
MPMTSCLQSPDFQNVGPDFLKFIVHQKKFVEITTKKLSCFLCCDIYFTKMRIFIIRNGNFNVKLARRQVQPAARRGGSGCEAPW